MTWQCAVSSTRCVLVVSGMGLLSVFGGCQRVGPTGEELERGLVWVFPGIEGVDWSVSQSVRAIRDAGVDSAIYTYNWKYPLGVLLNLMDERGNRQEAERIAREIGAYRRSHPTQPVDLLGYSGGGGLAVMVAEALDEEVRIRNVILVQAAISPDYDLSDTLGHVEGKVVNFYSERDWFILGLGTRVFGTMDRVQADSAGRVGFKAEQAVPHESARGKLEQCRWDKTMARTGHWGGHLSIMFYRWNKEYVTPYLKAQEG